jgi:structure-specific recognition protein 1
MRFFVPNNELDMINEEREQEEEKKKPAKKKGSKSSQDEDEEEEEAQEEELTAAKILNEKIIKAAGLGEFAGEMIATLPDLPMVIPRGKYSFDMYADFVKLHGKTNDYKIMYKDIHKCFLLPKPDDQQIAYVLALKVPLR